MARSSAAEFARRVEEVRPLVVECLSFHEIRMATIKHTTWGAQISASQLKRYVAAAHLQIEEAAQINRPHETGAAKLRIERMIAKSAARNDLRSELAANKQLIALLGLEAPKRSEIAHSGQIDLPAARGALTEFLAEAIAAGSYTPSDDGDVDDD